MWHQEIYLTLLYYNVLVSVCRNNDFQLNVMWLMNVIVLIIEECTVLSLSLHLGFLTFLHPALSLLFNCIFSLFLSLFFLYFHFCFSPDPFPLWNKVYSSTYSILTDLYLQFAEGKEIFRDYSFMYRVWYMTPVFFSFRMRIYSGFVLSECVCIMAGLGAYPVASEPKPGRGPSKYEALESRSEHMLGLYA